MSGLSPLKLTREKAAESGLASKSDLQTGYTPGKPKDSKVPTKKGGIKRSKRSKSKKNRRTRRR